MCRLVERREDKWDDIERVYIDSREDESMSIELLQSLDVNSL